MARTTGDATEGRGAHRRPARRRIAVIGYQAEPPLQLIYGIVAVVILGASLAPGVRAYLT